MNKRQIRALEITEYLTRLHEFKKEIVEYHESITDKNVSKIPLVMGGDFNDTPESSIIQTMYDPDLTYNIKFKNAYEVDGKFPEFTTYKYRTEVAQKYTIDHMFYSGALNLKSIWEVPGDSEIPVDTGLPCHRYPSDHFSLAATFEF